jgi:ferric iron reductase protein FhuF
VDGVAATGAVLAALRRAARVGPFFALPVGAGGPGWYRHADLTAPAGGPLLAAVLADYARRLPTAEPRVAASLLYQGYAALVWSPVLACLRDGVLLELEPTRFRLRCVPGESPAARLDSARGFALAGHAAAGDAPVGERVAALLAPMAAALRRVAPVSERLLAGNAASALVGAARVLARHDPAWTAEPLLPALLETPWLAGTTRLPGYRRRSCCLYYRVPGGGLCGDCALTAVPRPPIRPGNARI